MNILASSTRQYAPEQEWLLIGARHLLEGAFHTAINWVLHDKNPDLLRLKGPRTHRDRLTGNFFRHQTLLPFSAVVMAGTEQWRGEEMEALFAVLSHHPLPVYGLGLEMKNPPPALTANEKKCLLRPETLLTVGDEASAGRVHHLGLNPVVMPSPIIFATKDYASTHDRGLRQVAANGSRGPRLLLVLEGSHRLEFTAEEPLVRDLCHSVRKLSKHHQVEIVCPTIDDFMRFSTLFPNPVRYSYDASDYFSWFRQADLVITSNFSVALLANSLLKPALLVGLHQTTSSLQDCPFIFPVTATELKQSGERPWTLLPNFPAANGLLDVAISDWKDRIQRRWQHLFTRQINSFHPGFQGATAPCGVQRVQ